MYNTTTIMREGMNCLLEKLGTIGTEIFISHLLREPFDYTKWRRDNLYNDVSLHELNRQAAQYAKAQKRTYQLRKQLLASRRAHNRAMYPGILPALNPADSTVCFLD